SHVRPGRRRNPGDAVVRRPRTRRQLAAEAAHAGRRCAGFCLNGLIRPDFPTVEPLNLLWRNTMTRTTILTPEQVPAESKATLDAFTKNIGFTPTMMAAFAQSPIAFNAWAALLGSLSKALDVKTRDSIGLAVSEVNGCN